MERNDGQSFSQSSFVFISSCPEKWGGSEELWAQTAIQLAQDGHQIHVFKTYIDRAHPRIQALSAAGCTLTDLQQLLPWPVRLGNRILRNQWRYAPIGIQRLTQTLRKLQPQLTIVSQGNNFDGIIYANVCRLHNHPYVLIAQKAVNFFFPLDVDRSMIQSVYRSALRCYFVSQHNLALTRQQLSLSLPQAEVVVNPFNVAFNSADVLPGLQMTSEIHIACVARLNILDKGQDLLLEVLNQDKWRARPLYFTLFGAGPHQHALDELISFMNLANRVRLGGYVADPTTIWQTHQALILPSRSEGLPLALVEAMLCGRPAIATNAGGIAELLLDNVTGFLAATASVEALDEALERAWQRRTSWPQLGLQAVRHARQTIPADAPIRFKNQLLNLINTSIHIPHESTSSLDHHSYL